MRRRIGKERVCLRKLWSTKVELCACHYTSLPEKAAWAIMYLLARYAMPLGTMCLSVKLMMCKMPLCILCVVISLCGSEWNCATDSSVSVVCGHFFLCGYGNCNIFIRICIVWIQMYVIFVTRSFFQKTLSPPSPPPPLLCVCWGGGGIFVSLFSLHWGVIWLPTLKIYTSFKGQALSWL